MILEIGTWEKGVPVTLSKERLTTLEEGVRDLIRIGNNPTLDFEYAAFLETDDGFRVATLNIFRGLGDTYPNLWKITFARSTVDRDAGYAIEEEKQILPGGTVQHGYYVAEMDEKIREHLPVNHREYKVADPFPIRTEAIEAANLAQRRSRTVESTGKWG